MCEEALRTLYRLRAEFRERNDPASSVLTAIGEAEVGDDLRSAREKRADPASFTIRYEVASQLRWAMRRPNPAAHQSG